jgi:hypothetical protein
VLDKKKCEAFLCAQKNVAEQNTTKGASPTGVLCNLAAYWRHTVTVLLKLSDLSFLVNITLIFA